MRNIKSMIVFGGLLLAGASFAENDVERARDALAQSEEDTTAEQNLEEVFQAAEKNYTLLKTGSASATYSFDYSYFRDDRIDINLEGGGLTRFLIQNDAQHSFSSSIGVDYGVWDNLTLNARLPILFKFDTQKDVQKAMLGDVSFGMRWQPFSVKRGAPTTTLFGTFSTATGESPYEINLNNDVSGGKGYYSMTGGVSVSKVIDPAVLYGSMSYTMGFDIGGLNQQRGQRRLTDVGIGDSLGFSFGLAYSLSYDLSISASFQQSYSFDSEFKFNDGSVATTEDSTSANMNVSLGVRMSPERIVNFNFGFGLTEDSPDVLLGFSVPIDISGLKQL